MSGGWNWETGREPACWRDVVTAIAPGKRPAAALRESLMNSIIYLVGLIVIVMAILSFVGLG